jgi:hypothetical protein
LAIVAAAIAQQVDRVAIGLKEQPIVGAGPASDNGIAR